MSTLSAPQLTDLRQKAKLLIGMDDSDARYHVPGLNIFHDESVGTAATVQVEHDDATDVKTLTLANTGGDTDTFDLTNVSYDTLTELVNAVNALNKGWIAELLGTPAADSFLLVPVAATSCWGQGNAQVLMIENAELLDMLITNIWAGIETGLRRCLLSTEFSEVYARPQNGVIVLRQPDVSLVTMVATSTADGLRLEYTGTDTNAWVEVTDTSVITRSRVSGTTTTTTHTFAAVVNTTALAVLINATAGWSSTVINTFPSAFLVRQGSINCKNTQQTLEVWEDTDLSYWIEYVQGAIEFTDWPVTCPRIRIDYTAGFASIPADVEQAVLDGVKSAWDLSGTSTGLQSERLGDYSYTRAAGQLMAASRTAISEAVSQLETKYARLMI